VAECEQQGGPTRQGGRPLLPKTWRHPKPAVFPGFQVVAVPRGWSRTVDNHRTTTLTTPTTASATATAALVGQWPVACKAPGIAADTIPVMMANQPVNRDRWASSSPITQKKRNQSTAQYSQITAKGPSARIRPL